MKNQTRKIGIMGMMSFILLTLLIFNCTPDSNLRDGIREVNFKATANRTLITENETIVYKDSSTSVNSRIWTFEGGSINNSDLQEVNVVYDTPGIYDTTLEVIYDDNSTESNLFKVEVYPDVVANFTASETTTLFGTQITFTNSSENVESAFELARLEDGYVWTFEGGVPATSTEENPVVTYPTPGVYNVKLVAHREAPFRNGVLELNDHITVLAAIPLVPDFEANITSIEETQTVTFTDLTTGSADGWSWTFEGGTPATSTDQNPTITYNSIGTYDVTLTATRSVDGETQNITKTDYITVTAATGPYCTTPSNWVGCGNNDGEEPDLSDWEITNDSGGDISGNFSVSTDQFSEGTASLRHVYSEPGQPAFTDNNLRFKEILLNVPTAANYTLSMDMFGEILSPGNSNYVFEISFENNATGANPYKQFFNTAGGSWFSASTTQMLPPGDYYVRIQIWNPGFNANLKYNLFVDNIVVVQN